MDIAEDVNTIARFLACEDISDLSSLQSVDCIRDHSCVSHPCSTAARQSSTSSKLGLKSRKPWSYVAVLVILPNPSTMLLHTIPADLLRRSLDYLRDKRH